jgi:hypothetical protein
MPTKEIVSRLKEAYGEIYSASFGTQEYVFRPLTLGEYNKLLVSGMSSAEAEEYAVSCAVVWPDNPKLRPGTITALANEILDVSSFTNPKKAKAIFEEKRDHAQDVVNVMKSVVLACHAELCLTVQDLDDMTFSQLAEKVAIAEQIIQIKKSIYDPNIELQLEIIDPEEMSEKDRQIQEAEFEKMRRKQADPDASSSFGAARVDDPIAAKLHQALGGL